jgi:choline dehydrogenase-like flavoprotein
MGERHDTVVIGGGQAGLAMSAVLQRRGHEHIVLERGRVGERWRTERWDSLRFQFPNWSIQLPGYSYLGFAPGRGGRQSIHDGQRARQPGNVPPTMGARAAQDGAPQRVLRCVRPPAYARQSTWKPRPHSGSRTSA